MALALMALAPAPDAGAQAFEVFGLGLDDFTAAKTNPHIIRERRHDGPGYRQARDTHGFYISLGESDLIGEFLPYDRTYNPFRHYTDEQIAIARKFFDIDNFHSLRHRTPIDGDMSIRKLSALDDPQLDQMIAEHEPLVYAAWASWYSCGSAGSVPPCPAGIAADNVRAVHFLRPEGQRPSDEAIRLTVDVKTAIELEDAVAALRAAYPETAYEHIEIKGRDWAILRGETELLATDGRRFIVQISPARFHALFLEPMRDLQQQAVALYDAIQARGRALQDVQEQARANAITGN